MKKFLESGLLKKIVLSLCFVMSTRFTMAATQYLIANNDVAPPLSNSVSFYSVGPGGVLTLAEIVDLNSFGIGGGFFGPNRTIALNNASQQCIFVSAAYRSVIVGINVNTLTEASETPGSLTDGGTSNGIGLAMNGQYLYASFTDSNTIGTFQVTPNCGLTFFDDVTVGGLAGGIVNGMAIRGNMMVTTFTDGSIESFNISSGTPISNNDEQYSTATLASMDATYPNSVDITADGRFALFGDTSTSEVVEVSNMSSGKLTPTVVYTSKASRSSSNIMLSPDETLLYVINTQGDTVSAMFFNAATGVLTTGCKSGKIRGQSADWSYLAGLSLVNESGNGGGVFFAEYGAPSGIGLVTLTTSGAKCTLKEAKQSPLVDTNSRGLLSIGAFPPRSF